MIRNVFCRLLPLGFSLCVVSAVAPPALFGQADTVTPLRRQLDRVDVGLSGIGVFNSNTSGTNYATSNPKPEQVQSLTLNPGNTLGALLTIRYTKSPLLGAEFNASYARFTQKFAQTTVNADGSCPLCDFEVQANTSEYTLGYVAHLPSTLTVLSLGLQPFGGVGVGATAFRPTTFGGQGLKEQARMTYYYAVGVDAPLLFEGRAGLRAQVRQTFYLAPDFGQNYLTIKQRTNTFEPGIGVFFRF